VVLVFRGARLPLDHPLAICLGRIARMRPCTYLLLGGLSREDSVQVLERAAEAELDPRLVDAVYAETGGNPFFLGELGRHVRRGARPVAGPEGWGLPETILGAVALRLAPLSPQTRRMLELAAVFTSGFAF